jgi:low temperature requirement protein LtrA
MAYKHPNGQMDNIKKEHKMKKRLNRKYYKDSHQMLLVGIILLVIAILWVLAMMRYDQWRLFCIPAVLPIYGGLWLIFNSKNRTSRK